MYVSPWNVQFWKIIWMDLLEVQSERLRHCGDEFTLGLVGDMKLVPRLVMVVPGVCLLVCLFVCDNLQNATHHNDGSYTYLRTNHYGV